MKKIIAAFDGLQYSKSTRDYALDLAQKTNTHLVGVFMDDPTYTSYKIYELVEEEGISASKLKMLETKDREARATAATEFEKACQVSKIQFSIHHDHKLAMPALKHESIYADLLIIDSKETLTHYKEKLPTRFVRDIVGDAQCPVLVVPQKYKPIKKIIMLYDGEPSSVYAIKMFSYLIPEFSYLDMEVITVKQIGTTQHLPDNKLLKEFMKRHFSTVKYVVMKGYAEAEIINYLKQGQENALVVLGSNRRNTVSRWFRDSMADSLMKNDVKLPLFIAHHK
jgi:nucleotide-binding universal stress UspA family protein